MQANFLIDQTLGQQLIDFFAQSWIQQYDTSYRNISAKEASKTIFSLVDLSLKEGFSTSWTLGGTSNNCWGDSSSVSVELEPDLPFLDEFFIAFYPQISFMQYKIVSKAIAYSTSYENDYYGGSTTQSHKKLGFEQLSSAMIKANVIINPSVVRLETLESYIIEKYSPDNLLHIFKPVQPKKKKK